MGGVRFAFSKFIMRALSRTSGNCCAEAMQHVNRKVFRLIFVSLFLGSAPISVISVFLMPYQIVTDGDLPRALLSSAGGIYFSGPIGVTATCNVPMKKPFTESDALIANGQYFWAQVYVPHRTFWNAIRPMA